MSGTLAVGELYDPSRTQWPTTEQIRLGRSVAEVVRFWPGPSASEVRAHERGPAQFAPVDRSPDLLLLAYQYGELAWSDAPFQSHRMSEDLRGWPVGGPVAPLMFRTILVDANDGRVRGIRYDEWSVDFANAVRIAVAEQLAHPFDDQSAGRKLDELYGAYGTPVEMLRAEACSMCAVDQPSLARPDLTVYHH